VIASSLFNFWLLAWSSAQNRGGKSLTNAFPPRRVKIVLSRKNEDFSYWGLTFGHI